MEMKDNYLGEFRLPVHPMRDQLYNEMHARPFPVVEAPSLISHIAILSGERTGNHEVEHIAQLCKRYALAEPAADVSALYLDFGDFHLRWERHTEFSAYTFIRPFREGAAFVEKAVDAVPREWVESLCGEVVCALHGVIEKRDSHSISELECITDEVFDGERVNGSYAMSRRAVLCTSFKLHRGGFGRFYIENYTLSPQRTGRLLQRFLEIESYRLMALIALPLARKISPRLAALDEKVAEVTERVACLNKQSGEEKKLLEEISAVAAEVEQYRADTSYRFSAAKAYCALVRQRLEYVEEESCANFQTMSHFFARRFNPAMDTCEAVTGRLEELSKRLARTGDLLRTQVDLAIEQQNQNVLSAMNRRGKLQLRLQETVEGLSVVAISYYLVGLIKYFIDAGKPLGLAIDKSILVAATVIPVVAFVCLMTRKIKKRVDKDD